jgi:cytochrome c553
MAVFVHIVGEMMYSPTPTEKNVMMMKLMLTAASAALLLSGVASADDAQALAQKNACMSCHGVNKRSTARLTRKWPRNMPVTRPRKPNWLPK